MELSLKGRRALVSGSSQGIGLASAQALANLGASVTLLARNQKKLEQALSTLSDQDGQVHGILVADFNDPIALEQLVTRYVANVGGVQILINNTGGPPPGPASSANLQAFVEAFSQHLLCNQILVQAVLPGMQKAQWGRIVNVISTSVKQPIPNLGVSNTIRGAVANWAKTLAGELGPFGITVNNVLPGATMTPRLDAVLDAKAKKSGKPIDEVIEEEISHIPLRRFAATEELANVIAFLASPAASYVSGINVPVDGGRTLCL